MTCQEKIVIKATFFAISCLIQMSRTAEFDQKSEKGVESGGKSFLYCKDARILRESIPYSRSERVKEFASLNV